MDKHLNHYLALLRDFDPLTEEQHAAMDTRVRREVIARLGSFDVPQREAVHTSPAPRHGILIFLQQPAALVAMVVLIVTGALVVTTRSGEEEDAVIVDAPQTSSSVVAHVEPVGPGSGRRLSVFGGTVAVVPEAEVMAPPQTKANQQPVLRTTTRVKVNPASGVFVQWGTNVFNEEELLKNARAGKHISS